MIKNKFIPFFSLAFLLSGCSLFTRHDDQGRTLAPVKATSKPYKIKGKRYYPQPHYEYEQEGIASFYGGGDVFHGRPTANGERFDMHGMTAAHKTLPLPCMVEVTNLKNGKQVRVRVNDRGPFIKGRIIDMSRRGAQLLGFERQGTSRVRVRTLVPETLAMNHLPGGRTFFGPSERVMVAEAKAAPSTMPDLTPVVYETPTVIERVQPQTLAQDFVRATQPPAPRVTAVAYVPRTPMKTGIFVDVGSYSSLTAGQGAAESLSQITESTVGQTSFGNYTVRMGPIQSLADANRLVDHLENVGHDTLRIIHNR